MFANFATAISTSTVVTLSLFYLMNLLISMQPGAVVDPGVRHPIIWDNRTIEDTPPETLEYKLTKEFIKPPVAPSSEAPGDNEAIPVTRPTATPPPVSGYQGTGLVIQDGPLVALVRVSPTYPARAQQLGLDGWVLVQFDVLANGTVANVAVVDSSHSMFETAARRAAERFRFKAQVVDGVPIETTGMQNLFTFRMED